MLVTKANSSFQIDCRHDMPTIPAVMFRIIQSLDDGTATARKMEDLILHDPSLSARILRVANSPLYAFRSEVKTISHAIALLGLNLVKGLVIGVSIFDSFTRNMQNEAAHINNLWMHSYGVGLISQEIWKARSKQKASEFAFLCGLLHDVGKVVYFKKVPAHYSHVFAQEREGNDPDMTASELEYYGISHAPLGATLAECWGFPSELCAVIRKHHSAPEPHSPIVATVSVADTITRLSGIGYDGDHRPNPGSSIPRAMLNIGAEELERLRSFAEAKRPEIEAFFRLAA